MVILIKESVKKSSLAKIIVESEDDNQALMNELERLKKERAEEEERKNLEDQQKKMSEITKNPLLNPDYSMKVDWRDETVFRNQAVDVDETDNMRKKR